MFKQDVIAVFDNESGSSVCLQFLVLPPKDCGYSASGKLVQKAVDEVKKENPGEWNYTEVLDKLTKRGFRSIQFSEFIVG